MHYRIIETLFPAFFIWQSLSMSQFTLERKTYAPKLHNNHNILASLSLIIQLIILFHGFYNTKLYTDESLNFILIVLSIASVTLYRLSSISCIIESHLNRKNEMRFLSLIAKSDEILMDKLHVDMKYKEQWQNNIQQLIIRILVYLILNGANIIDWIVVEVPVESTIWFYLIAFQIFICSMRYHQIISYVNLIHDRYKLLNEYIEKIRCQKIGSIGLLFEVTHKHSVEPWKNNNFESAMIRNKLKIIQEIQRHLLDARAIINNSFKWSLLFNLVNDFHITLTSAYFLVFLMINHALAIELISGATWILQGFMR